MKFIHFEVKKSATKARSPVRLQRKGVAAPDNRHIAYVDQDYAAVDKTSRNKHDLCCPTAMRGTFPGAAPTAWPILKSFTFSYSDDHRNKHTATLMIPSGEHCLEVLAQVSNAFFPRCPPGEDLVAIVAGSSYIDRTSHALVFDNYSHGTLFHVFFTTVAPSDGFQDDTEDSEDTESGSEAYSSTGKIITNVKRSSEGGKQATTDAGHLELRVDGELSGLSTQFRALQRPTKLHPHFQLEQQQHLGAMMQNWDVDPANLLFDQNAGIDIRPKQLEAELEDWELNPGFQRRYKQRCKQMGWEEDPDPDPQNPLDWDMDLLVYLSNLSDYTVDASKDAILAVLNVAVMKRLELGYGGGDAALAELKAEDVLKVVKKLIQHKGVVDPMKLIAEREFASKGATSPDVPVGIIDPQDVVVVAAHLLLQADPSRHNNAKYVLNGPEDITVNQIVKTVEEHIGTKIKNMSFKDMSFAEYMTAATQESKNVISSIGHAQDTAWAGLCTTSTTSKEILDLAAPKRTPAAVLRTLLDD